MFNNKNELIKQVNWALRAREPIGFRAVSEVTAKWEPVGYEVRFDGGQAVIAHFEGVLWHWHGSRWATWSGICWPKTATSCRTAR